MKLLTKYRETLDSDDFFCFKPWIDESGKRHFNLKKVLRHFKHKLLKDSYVPIYNQFINEITKYDTIVILNMSADLCMPIQLNRIRQITGQF